MKVKFDTNRFRVKEEEVVELGQWPTKVKPFYKSKKDYKELLESQVSELSELQKKHYASNRHAVLFIFQAMDAAGKDGAIRHVMSGVNPQGCQVSSVQHPSAKELDHDFLWRTNKALPERGHIGIFNRSYYEEVLIVRVHHDILHSQNLPDGLLDECTIWEGRYQSISDMEAHLHRNGTHICKFFLHLSKDEQRKRFIDRIDNPDKNWKLSMADIEERKYWDDYMRAYEHCLSNTSTDESPWYVIPADDKKNARLMIAQIIINTFKSLPIAYPKVSPARRRELKQIRKTLTQGSGAV
ncbi:ADP-polyphosphate phosphotransferase [Marinobacter sp. 1_MG-2023]|uniref:ADP-polyphosphate phosphotransferase n=1 Tax=Marinobacter sp. 1_MG-2023 TaxID=3062627 RepID=UPI0026E20DA2|nr:ADP-polyphosphate phosphotransferase [Marinobacter sp. 1_MG-2023]MDO6824420.1 polyphosphate kinase 2 family protein [Marinobacter sp. 1_MG-2023]